MNPAAITREDPGKWGSLVLTVFIHGALVLLLFFGVQWQRHPPPPVQVELVRSLPPLPAPEPRVVTPQEPPPPPKPVPKEVEPPVIKKPDIALPKEPEKPIKKEKPPVEPPKPPEKVPPKPEKAPPKPEKAVPPAEPVKPQRDPRVTEAERQAMMLNLASDEARRKAQMQTSARNKADQDTATVAALSKAEAEWIDAIRLKVAGQLSAQIPPGSPQPEFLIELLPSGEVASVQLSRSSGNKALDEAMERAINKSSPLPKPTRPEVFRRSLRFVFKPRSD